MRKRIQEYTTERKKKKTYPVRTICKNCGTQQISRYCHNCGQDIFSGSERSLKEITNNVFDTVFAWDNKIYSTLKHLIFYPGKLTKEFFNGKIASYVFPSKLFWFMSILFFATLSLDNKLELYQRDLNKIVEVVETNISSETMKVTDRDMVYQQIRETLDERIKNNEVSQLFINYAPYAIFLLIPFFALLVQMFYFRKCRYYASQMIFSLHFHSFLFLLLTVINLIILFFPTFEDNNHRKWIYFLLPVVYFIISLYVVYRPRKRHLLWKLPLIFLFYTITLFVVIVLLAIFAGFLIYGIDFMKEVLAEIFE